MKKFVAIAIRQSTSDSPEHTTLYEEATLIVKAFSVEDAKIKVEKYFEGEHVYISAAGFKVATTLIKIEDVNEVLGIVNDDIEEINSRFFRDYDAYSKFREMLE